MDLFYNSVVMQNAVGATGNGTAVTCADGVACYNTLVAQIKGISTATITWEATVNGADWVAIQATSLNAGTAATTATADGIFRITVSGLYKVRARISAWTSGTITVTAILTV